MIDALSPGIVLTVTSAGQHASSVRLFYLPGRLQSLETGFYLFQPGSLHDDLEKKKAVYSTRHTVRMVACHLRLSRLGLLFDYRLRLQLPPFNLN
jgi:hypothetical protein